MPALMTGRRTLGSEWRARASTKVACRRAQLLARQRMTSRLIIRYDTPIRRFREILVSAIIMLAVAVRLVSLTVNKLIPGTLLIEKTSCFEQRLGPSHAFFQFLYVLRSGFA